MADHIRITRAQGNWTVRAGGAILAESTNALELTETGYDAVIYFPREDIAMTFLERSETRSHCPHKGDANYFSIVTKSGQIHDAAWSYETPLDAMERIAGHLAFYPDKVTLERI
ncbi:DUF427 domain-containing protein [Solirhodobacter olei]|uniref:DUF427 domain-containing protein n=1 Tax=Solirhodobacter olei TaxID=2493082 RepID=UPI000FD84625|nr:DUF427 domain-containing protein [Solirhodobacter olei]